MMGFGHRNERDFDGVMRMGFRLDGDYERPVGVALRQHGQTIDVTVEAPGTALTDDETEVLRRQVARIVSLDHDGDAFHRLCLADAALAPVHQKAPGFRPSNFASPYEALIWSVISARRARPQGIALRARIAEAHGTVLEVDGVPTPVVPDPEALLKIDSFHGLPADRIPRLHAVANAAIAGDLSADRLRALPPEEAKAQLQTLPGIGPFYSALVVIRALGHADVLSLEEEHSRNAVQELYGVDHHLSDEELTKIAETWRPFRTWVTVMLRALGGRPAK